MYDWNALWHEREAYRTGYDIHHGDANMLAEPLKAKLIHAAETPDQVAVYEDAHRYILAGHADGLQLLEVFKHGLFDITLRFVGEDEGQDAAVPYIELHVDNLATEEQAVWRGEAQLDEEGRVWIGKRTLDEDVLPAMPFDELSFTDQAVFRDELARVWHEDLPQLRPLIEAWFRHDELAAPQDEPAHYGDQERVMQICDRYAEIVRREQAALSRLFSDDELRLMAGVIGSVHFDSAASCRGVWLAVEARIIEDELDQQFQLDGEALLAKMKGLSYAQEVALIEALSPLKS
ncbi:hypothetical protein KIF53_09785 [Chromobacterium subtsugae]|uniref:Uncharacterized protein n=1 Tax=Chromobacterium subtsugae TaxID=251747 RepID=A0ABS7FCV6_9NEIS|nr:MULTISPECIES: hypothetical protein [Chromobacterium]KUM05517.1 hypothetical protein Cv017_08605 [Chromobacterium subtsugae]KZE88233.1 hypothetical protein AWB61_07845 [Chromobacterium sp. F49]MBW7565586.1 hypothetical protein [Chromobacterium subtsugae]MBW8287915.1 hypothetical protein [Chromobacterium subtsugae]OBU86933.1 hypothetical protein MY55_09120 [Chromobacterium subtsugae]